HVDLGDLVKHGRRRRRHPPRHQHLFGHTALSPCLPLPVQSVGSSGPTAASGKNRNDAMTTKSTQAAPISAQAILLPAERQRLEDIGFMTCMTLTLLGNYAQTGHFGGPLAYTPFNVAAHLIGPALGGLQYDYRRPKHPYGDKFMLAAGHCAPTCYALWMIMGQALAKKYQMTGERKYFVAADVAMLPVD